MYLDYRHFGIQASSPSLHLSQECEVHILSYATILANQGRLDLALFYASKVVRFSAIRAII
jgi:hypothetical protein